MRATIICVLLISSLSRAGAAQDKPAKQSERDQNAVHALLRISHGEPRLLAGSESKSVTERSEFETYRRTQATLIRSPFVLNAALRKPQISGLKLIQEHKADPLAWLASVLEVDFPDDAEILRIALRGDNPIELRDLVNAVTDAYLEEVVNQERNKRLVRVTQLHQIYTELEEKSRLKREQLRKLSQVLGISNVSVVAVKQRFALEESAAVRRELRQVKLELIRVRARRASVEKLTSGANEPPIDELEVAERVEASADVKKRYDRIEKLVEKIELVSQTDKEDSPALKRLLDLLSVAERDLEKFRSEMANAVLERMRRQARIEALADARQLDEQIALLTEEKEFLESTLAAATLELEQATTGSAELEFLKHDIERSDQLTQAVATELESLKIELRAPPRVNLIQHAESK